MSLCTSCGNPFRDVIRTSQDGYQYHETFCGRCLNMYVRNADELETKEYAFEHLTDLRYSKFQDNSIKDE